ncbi:transposase [Rhodococcus sp. 14-2483-1-1]|uniref:transposase n=1 Tax=Rhodococcus sp. 14-2483-1-1 TaxID=2023148 RepID=UPI000B9B7673|nr:transposase [Rhodococcus sp. 14-2483-1-1]OZF39872.1 transposase [Rhodococcus sp. 14-2483-1-1]
MSSTGTVSVDHHQFVVGSPSAETYEPSTTGSVIEVGPNFVTIMTGVAYGPVAVSIETLDAHPGEPSTPSEWEVIEEATIKVTASFRVLSLDGEAASDFSDMPIRKGWNTFRVSARGRDARWDLTVSEPTEEYLVQIWKTTRPAPMRRIHKRDKAWDDDIVTHRTRNWWDPDPAGDATLYLKYGYEQMAIWAKQEAIDWGGRPPTDKLRHTAYAKQFAAHDRMLVDALARTRAPKLRKIAAWAARRAYTIAGVADIEWIRDGLDALDNGTPLPPPFTDRHSTAVIDAFNADERIQLWTTSESGDTAPTAALAAVNALTDASWTDPLPALFNVLWTLLKTQGSDYGGLIADLRHAFYPKLAPADQYERWIGLTVDDVP